MIYAKVGVDKTTPFGPVLAADGTMSSGALAYTDFKIFKNGTDGALNASATATHKYEGQYALLLKAADLDAVGDYVVVLNKNPLSAAPLQITVLSANVYDWLFGTAAPNTTKTGFALASDGLDSVAITAPTGVASNFREMLVALWRELFKKTTFNKTTGDKKTYADNGTSVLTTQACSDDGTTQTRGAST